MTTYQPLIPTGTVNLDVDYKNLQNNFQALDTIYGLDHVAYSNTTVNKGLHTVIHLVDNSTTATNPPNNFPIIPPAPIADTGEIFATQTNDGINTDDVLWWQTSAGRLTQMTRNFQPTVATNGATYLPGGLILNWGSATILKSGLNTPPIVFTQPYGSAAKVYSITIGCINNDGTNNPSANNVYIKIGTVTSSQFTISNSSSGSILNIYWMAIGS